MTRRVDAAEWAARGHALGAVAEPAPIFQAALERIKPRPPAVLHCANPMSPAETHWYRWWLRPGATLDKALFFCWDEIEPPVTGHQ